MDNPKQYTSYDAYQAHRRNALQAYDGATLQMQLQEKQKPMLHQQQRPQRLHQC
jgi:hypothetical protein